MYFNQPSVNNPHIITIIILQRISDRYGRGGNNSKIFIPRCSTFYRESSSAGIIKYFFFRGRATL